MSSTGHRHNMIYSQKRVWEKRSLLQLRLDILFDVKQKRPGIRNHGYTPWPRCPAIWWLVGSYSDHGPVARYVGCLNVILETACQSQSKIRTRPWNAIRQVDLNDAFTVFTFQLHDSGCGRNFIHYTPSTDWASFWNANPIFLFLNQYHHLPLQYRGSRSGDSDALLQGVQC